MSIIIIIISIIIIILIITIIATIIIIVIISTIIIIIAIIIIIINIIITSFRRTFRLEGAERPNMAGITAADFERLYGALVRTEYAEYTGRVALRTALGERQPPIVVSDGLLRQWLKRSVKPLGANTVSSAGEVWRPCKSLSGGACDGV